MLAIQEPIPSSAVTCEDTTLFETRGLDKSAGSIFSFFEVDDGSG